MKNKRLMLAGLLLISMNLRAPFTSMAPLLDDISTTFALSATQAGLLIAVPLLAFSAVSPFAAGIAGKWGLERTLFFALLLIGAGILFRAGGSSAALYVGTIIIGSGIAFGNVLLPSLLKRDFADKVPSLTATYVLTMGVAAASSSAVVHPLLNFAHTGWRAVSQVTLILTVAAALVWLPQLRRTTSVATAAAAAADKSGNNVWRSPLAWLVTVYLGFDCFLYYAGVSWLPAILRDMAGYSAETAASLHGVLLLATAVPGLILIPLTPKLRDQRALAFAIAMGMAVGMFGFVLAPSLALLWIIFFGIGAGGGLIVALSFFSLRTTSAGDAAALSGMSQCVGYLIAATGPTLIGRVHDLAGSWTLPLSVCGVFGVVMAIVGWYAGRNVQIGVPVEAKREEGFAAFSTET